MDKQIMRDDGFFNIFVMVFHRILDFKPGLNFYSDPFFLHNTERRKQIPGTAGVGRSTLSFRLPLFYFPFLLIFGKP